MKPGCGPLGQCIQTRSWRNRIYFFPCEPLHIGRDPGRMTIHPRASWLDLQPPPNVEQLPSNVQGRPATVRERTEIPIAVGFGDVCVCLNRDSGRLAAPSRQWCTNIVVNELVLIVCVAFSRGGHNGGRYRIGSSRATRSLEV